MTNRIAASEALPMISKTWKLKYNFDFMFNSALPLYTDHLHTSQQIKPMSNEKHPSGNSLNLLR